MLIMSSGSKKGNHRPMTRPNSDPSQEPSINAHQTSDHKASQAPGLMDELWDWVKSIAIALALVIFIHQFVFNLSTVRGHSMEPTLLDGEWLFINKLVYWIGDPQRGDIVIFKETTPDTEKAQYLVKRVVGIAGDKLEIHAGRLYINGQAAMEPYTDTRIQGDMAEVVVREGHLFVMGDNRHAGASKDSRFFGQIAVDEMKGRAQFILWPLSKAGSLDRPEYE
jgi:signal peptidase I